MPHNDQVIEAIKNLYASLPKPILLSTLGYELRQKGCAVSGSIRKFIDEQVEGFTTIQHPKIRERIAISSNEDMDSTRVKIENVGSDSSGDNQEFFTLNTLYKSVLFAFCSNFDVDSYLSLQPPCKFTNEIVGDESKFKKILKEDKLAISIPVNINKLQPNDARRLLDGITQWCEKNSIDIELFKRHKKTPPSPLKREGSSKQNYKSILPQQIVKFIECQPEDVKKNLVIPLELFM